MAAFTDAVENYASFLVPLIFLHFSSYTKAHLVRGISLAPVDLISNSCQFFIVRLISVQFYTARAFGHG